MSDVHARHMTYVYALLESYSDGKCHVIGIYSTEGLGMQAFLAHPGNEGVDIQLEEWPVDSNKHRFNVRVVDGK